MLSQETKRRHQERKLSMWKCPVCEKPFKSNDDLIPNVVFWCVIAVGFVLIVLCQVAVGAL
jgi:hypothetical protein